MSVTVIAGVLVVVAFSVHVVSNVLVALLMLEAPLVNSAGAAVTVTV